MTTVTYTIVFFTSLGGLLYLITIAIEFHLKKKWIEKHRNDNHRPHQDEFKVCVWGNHWAWHVRTFIETAFFASILLISIALLYGTFEVIFDIKPPK